MLSKYGTDNIVIMLISSAVIILMGIFLFPKWTSILLLVLGTILLFFTIWFFRDPDRVVPRDALIENSLLVSPADGKIVEIVNEREDVYLNSEAIRISIFLSPLDVHVNRIPISGEIEHLTYHPGDYMVAYHPKSSEKNEQTKIGLLSPHGKILFKQIVGVVARRLVWDIKIGDKVTIGDRFGMMKFGSRMDVFVSKDSKILINVGDKVVAGESIIAKLQ